MLTKQEQEWLRNRPAYTSIPLSKYDHWYQYFEYKCRDWAESNYNAGAWLRVMYCGGMDDDILYKDAAEFESRVSLQASRWQHGWENYCRFCPVRREPDCSKVFESRIGFTCHRTNGVSWLVLKAARLRVEEEMDNAN